MEYTIPAWVKNSVIIIICLTLFLGAWFQIKDHNFKHEGVRIVDIESRINALERDTKITNGNGVVPINQLVIEIANKIYEK